MILWRTVSRTEGGGEVDDTRGEFDSSESDDDESDNDSPQAQPA